MSLKTIAGFIAVLLVLAFGWQQRKADWVRALTEPEPPRRVIKFDNDLPPVPASGPPPKVNLADVPSGMRKCLVGKKVIYTDRTCPQGATAEHVGGIVTVVPGTAPQAAATPGGQPGDANRPKTVRDLYAEPAGPNLREQRMEQAINR